MLTFEQESHTYKWNGRPMPSVTQILRVIENFSMVDPDLLEKARRFGSHVHLATDLFDRGELDEESLDANLLPYLNAYKKFLSETGFVVTHSEQRVYNARYKYCGTLDKRGTWKNTTWVLDLKSGAVPRSVGPQVAAYQMACDEKPRKRLCLQLMRNCYKLHRCDDLTDWSIFLSCRNIHQFNDRTTHVSETETRVAV
jgi:hypothetical protein